MTKPLGRKLKYSVEERRAVHMARSRKSNTRLKEKRKAYRDRFYAKRKIMPAEKEEL